LVDNFHRMRLVPARLTVGYLKIDHRSIETVWGRTPDLNLVPTPGNISASNYRFIRDISR
jgi:hypothetical protein